MCLSRIKFFLTMFDHLGTRWYFGRSVRNTDDQEEAEEQEEEGDVDHRELVTLAVVEHEE